MENEYCYVKLSTKELNELVNSKLFDRHFMTMSDTFKLEEHVNELKNRIEFLTNRLNEIQNKLLLIDYAETILRLKQIEKTLGISNQSEISLKVN